MKYVRLIAVLALALVALAGPARGAYVNREFRPGENLFGNPLLNDTTNNLSTIIPSPPEGTTVSLWNPTVGAYTTTTTFSNGLCGGWCADFVMLPGQGARLVTGTLFTNTFVGTVLNADGSVYISSMTPPPVFTGSNGIYLLSCKAPLALSGTDTNVSYPVFVYILGRGPLAGETFTRLNPTNQTYRTTTWSGSAWSDGVPALDASEAGLFNIGPVPVPRFEVTAIAREGNNVRISWTSFGPHTNRVQATNGNLPATNVNSFADISDDIIVPGSGQSITNYLDVGGATNFPSRYYRIRLVP